MSFIITDPKNNFIKYGSGNDFAEKVVDVSSILKHNVPGFIKEDYPLFVAFLEAYYEFLEQKNQVLFESKKAIHYQDIDTTLEEFVEHFRKEFMVDIPKNILADKRTLLKNIKQFYRARGSEKSFRLLFRILYNTEIDFYYPREDVLKTSDGKWIQEKSMKLRVVSGNAFDLVSREICGNLSGAKAVVENVIQYNTSAYTVFEVFLSPQSISGTFLAGETLECGAGDIVAEVYPVVIGLKITGSGKLYEENEEVYFSDVTGTGAKGRIKTVDSEGGIRFVEIENSGVNYSANVSALFPVKASTATAEPVLGTIFTYPGYYLNEDGQLSTTKFLQDSYFYQQYSYVIFASESVERFRDIVSKILHPCGLIMFGGLRYTDVVDGSFEIIDSNSNHSTITNQFRFFISAKKNIDPAFVRQDARRNLLLHTENFANAVWNAGTNATVESNYTESPIGTLTADRLIGTGSARRDQTITKLPNVPYIFSIWLKRGTQLNGFPVIHLVGNGATIYTLDNLTDDWKRYHFLFDGDSSTSFLTRLYVSSAGSPSVGDNIIAWGAMMEKANLKLFPSEYERNGSTVTSSKNIQVDTESFSSSNWAKVNTTIESTAATIAPDGTLTGNILKANASNSTHFINGSVSTESSGLYSSSIFVKYNNHRYVSFALAAANSGSFFTHLVADLLTGEITYTNKGSGTFFPEYGIENIGGDWFRLYVAGRNARTDMRLTVAPVDSATPNFSGIWSHFIYTWNATGEERIFIWGAQTELLSIDPTDYQKVDATFEPQTFSKKKRLHTSVIVPKKDPQSYGSGTSLRNLNRFKGTYLPSPIQNPDLSYVPPPNENYWERYGNLQIKDIGKILLKDLFYNPWKKFQFQPDPFFNWISLNNNNIQTTSDYNFHEAIPMKNLNYASEVLNDGNGWTTNVSANITANDAVAPDGTLTADKMIVNGSGHGKYGGLHSRRVFPIGTPLCFSYYAKAVDTEENYQIGLSGVFGGNIIAVFNTKTGALVTTSGNIEETFSQSVGNGWFRFGISGIVQTIGQTLGLIYRSGFAETEGTWFWGMQLEEGLTPTEYHNNQSAIYGTIYSIPDRIKTNYDLIPEVLERPRLSENSEKENMIRDSKFLNSSFISRNNLTVTDYNTTDPITGIQDVARLNESAGESQKYIETFSILRTIIGKQYILTCYAKANGRNWLRLQFNDTIKPNSFATFNLVTKSVYKSTELDYATVVDETDLPSGWVKLEIAVTATANVTSSAFFFISDNKDNMTYTGDGTSGIFLTRIQLRRSDTSSEYLETEKTSKTSGFKDKRVAYFYSGNEILKSSLKRRNLWNYTEPLSGTGYASSTGAVFRTSTQIPDVDGEVYFEDAVANREIRQNTPANPAGKIYTLSFDIKMDNGELPNQGAGNYRDFTLTWDNTDQQNYNAFSYVDKGNGLYRVSISRKFASNSTSITIRKYLGLNTNTGITISRIQLEENLQGIILPATDYQKVTTTTPVYDTLSNFSNTDSSTSFIVFETYMTTQGILFRDTNDKYRIRISGGNLQVLLDDGSVKTIEQTIEAGKRYVAMIKYSSGNVSLSLNGGIPETISVGSISDISGNIEIGEDFIGKIGRIIFNKKVPQNSWEEKSILQTLMAQYGIEI